MKLFDVAANIIAAFLVWSVMTSIIFFLLSWGSDSPSAKPVSIWPRIVLIAASAFTFSLYVKHYWKKLER